MKIRVTVPTPVGVSNSSEEALGLALSWMTELVVDPSKPGATVEGVPEVFERFHGATGKRVPCAGLTLGRRAPFAESSSLIVGALLAADALCETGLSRMRILELAVSHGGRMDAAAASLYGGAVLVVARGGTPTVVPLRVPASWKVVLRDPDDPGRADVSVGLAVAAITHERADLLAAAFGPDSKGFVLVPASEAERGRVVEIAPQGARVEPLT